MDWSLKFFSLSLCCIFVLPADGYSVVSGNDTRNKRQACEGFLCTSTKECIADELKCDGTVDCRDGSDEFQGNCKDIYCPGYLFTCDYGACINADKKCDGKKDCRDNSDEANCVDTQVAPNQGSNCKSDQFECNSGQCISLDNKCDGVHDCNDKSDETKAACLNIQCPGYTYKCSYGACVNGFGKCDGVKDCVDNSDEEDCGVKPSPTPPIITPKPDTGPGKCVLPQHPANGKWNIIGNARKTPGQRVSENTLLMFECNKDYKLTTESSLMLCSEEGWMTSFPQCEKKCDALFTSNTVMVKCFDKKKNEISCSEAIDGATAEFECSRFYESIDNTNKRYCFKGFWDLPPPRCKPVCGEKRVSAEPLIVNGITVERGNYPWVTALFVNDKGTFINACGGTMLNQRVILTAAHCVTDDNAKVVSPELLKIAVGKYYNEYLNENDTEAQYSDIQEVIVHKNYRGDAQRFTSDIALLITKDKLAFSKVVQPICIAGLKSMNLPANAVGTVAGWGYTVAGGTPAHTLQEVDVFYKDDAACRQEFPSDWGDKYLGYDKFCAGHYNKSIAVCKGDSGSGFVVPLKNGRYYVYGIVSLSHKVGGKCDIQLSALYTRVAEHYDMIEENVAKYAN